MGGRSTELYSDRSPFQRHRDAGATFSIVEGLDDTHSERCAYGVLTMVCDDTDETAGVRLEKDRLALLVAQDEYNWAFAQRQDDEPVIVPHAVSLVPVEVAFHVARKVGFNNYFEALDLDADPFPVEPPPGTRPS